MSEIAEQGLSEAKRIAQFLGLPNWRRIDDLGLVDSVRNGFPTASAAKVARRIDPHGRFVKASDIIPKATLSRRKDQHLSKDDSERLLALSRVFSEALRIYKSDAELAAQFLSRAHPMLNGRRPIDLAKESIAGADLVLKLLVRADAGVAA